MDRSTGTPLETLSPWWRHAVILVMVFGFTVLIWMAVRSYRDAPPIPARVVDAAGATLFTRDDILAGQQVFLAHGLMENGTIWGHGAYLGPDFSAAYLHALGEDTRAWLAERQQGSPAPSAPASGGVLGAETASLLQMNRYDPATGTLPFTPPEAASYRRQIGVWTDYFAAPTINHGLPPKTITNPDEMAHLTAFFAWTAWASIARRPGRPDSYTNNFPFDPSVGNAPGADAILWSALSLIALLGGIALTLFSFGKFDFLGWKGGDGHVHPRMLPGETTASQRAAIKYFVVVSVLFLAQVLVGGATAHYRVDPGSFYGIDLARFLPSQIVRTWHLQLAIFWIATAYVAGALFLAPALGRREPAGQRAGVNVLFAAIVAVAVGSLAGEYLGAEGYLGRMWFWLGHQGWEYLDLGRLWQILLAAGLAGWVVLLLRAVGPSRSDPERGGLSALFLYAGVAIPVFYLPAMFFGPTTHFSVVDTWRFWIIHLWVEGFFELFVTVMVAVIFYLLGVIRHTTAQRVVYLDAILYLGSGIIGTGHHWYWTGQSSVTMALAAVFSAMEVVPLTLLTLDAWDFVKLTRGRCDVCGKDISVPHRWTFYFLMAVGFWNFVGAGIFGFLINLPVVSYFEVGTILTPNHGHTAMMGVFGMLAMALMVFALRQVSTEAAWRRIEPAVRVSFWGLNAGLALMVITNLFPGGVLQLVDAVRNGYWHARGPEFLDRGVVRAIEWLRLPADMVFIGLGVAPMVLASLRAWRLMRQREGA
jgi:nitric oxide reductase subunit B